MLRIIIPLRLLALCAALIPPVCRAESVLVEAEQLADTGGWTIDSQFVDEMGSPYLLAHTLGVPAADATGSVDIPADGLYTVYARTYNWTSPWCDGPGAGQFKVAVNGTELPATLGAAGNQWQWQEAGKVHLNAGTATLALRDLTGFDSRCDAIFLTTDTVAPPATAEARASLRRAMGSEPVHNAGDFDLVVVGGGIAGMHAAMSAARLGCKVALVQNRPVLGGNNSSEVRVHLGGASEIGRYPQLGAMLKEYAPDVEGNAQPAGNYADDRKLEWILSEPNITLLLNTHINYAETDHRRIIAVEGVESPSGRRVRLGGALFCDATGDGSLGVLAGADFRIGREGTEEFGEPSAPALPDSMTMGASVQWRTRELKPGERPFALFEFGLALDSANCRRTDIGEWTWETGMHSDQLRHFERVRDYGMFVAYSNWSFITNRLGLYPGRTLDWVAFVGGKRETRRLMGDYILREQDLTGRVAHPDATFAASWSMDLHFPDPENAALFPTGAFIATNRHIFIHPTEVPYRCLYSRNVGNLFMAGRNVSCTHVALGSLRVMRTTAMMGEVVGMAAYLCRLHGIQPRQVYTDGHLPALRRLMTDGVARTPLPYRQDYNIGHHLTD